MIKSIEEANKFLNDYMPIYNKKFSIKAEKQDYHIPMAEGIDLDRILCLKAERTVRNDNTITYKNELYQIEEVIAGKVVMVTERIDGIMEILYQNRSIKYKPINIRPMNPKKKKLKKTRRTACIPSLDHPWRKYNKDKNLSYNEKNIVEAFV